MLPVVDMGMRCKTGCSFLITRHSGHLVQFKAMGQVQIQLWHCGSNGTFFYKLYMRYMKNQDMAGFAVWAREVRGWVVHGRRCTGR